MSKYLYKNKWVSLKETERHFVYAERKNVNSTATLLFKKDKSDYKFLLRYQPLPELNIIEYDKLTWTTLYPCCVTGSLEENETPIQNAIKEVLEETNYEVDETNIKASQIVVSSTQMNECVYTFVIDITNAKHITKKTGDGSIFENISQNHWVSHKKLKEILTNNNNIYLSSLASAYLLFLRFIDKKL